MTTQTHKLDVFALLGAINSKNVKYWNTLTPEELKSFAPIVVMRWLSGNIDPQQIFLLNEFVNPYVFSLHKHPQLLYYLMIVANSGKQRNPHWPQKLSSAATKKPISNRVVCETYGYSIRESEQALIILKKGDVYTMAYDLGYQTDELQKLRKEWGDGALPKQSPSSRPSSSKIQGVEF